MVLLLGLYILSATQGGGQEKGILGQFAVVVISKASNVSRLAVDVDSQAGDVARDLVV
jgi:hypothetical protein